MESTRYGIKKGGKSVLNSLLWGSLNGKKRMFVDWVDMICFYRRICKCTSWEKCSGVQWIPSFLPSPLLLFFFADSIWVNCSGVEWSGDRALGGNEIDFLTGRKRRGGEDHGSRLLEMNVIAADWFFCVTSASCWSGCQTGVRILSLWRLWLLGGGFWINVVPRGKRRFDCLKGA